MVKHEDPLLTTSREPPLQTIYTNIPSRTTVARLRSLRWSKTKVREQVMASHLRKFNLLGN